jgi:hypothetical protein
VGRLRGPLAITEFQEAKTVVHSIPPVQACKPHQTKENPDARQPDRSRQEWLQNLLDPEIVNSLVAPDATYVSLNTEDAELSKIMPWAGTSHGPQSFLDTSTRCSAAGRTRRST